MDKNLKEERKRMGERKRKKSSKDFWYLRQDHLCTTMVEIPTRFQATDDAKSNRRMVNTRTQFHYLHNPTHGTISWFIKLLLQQNPKKAYNSEVKKH